MNITAALLTRLKCFLESIVISGWVIGRVDFMLLRYSNLTSVQFTTLAQQFPAETSRV